MMIWVQKHTQYPGPGRTEKNVVGYPFFPVYTAKAGGFFFIVFGVTSMLGGLAQINPIWLYGSYNPSQITAGSQPDWYIGWLDGALRTMPNWETSAFGHTISWNVFLPSVVIPGLIFTALGAYPFIEQWVTGDKREHHLLDRPRNQPVRTGIGIMALTFYTLLWINGGNDIIATNFDLSINTITWTIRVLLIVLPPIAFVITKRICLALQRRDRDRIMHGRETGVITRLPHGEFVEVHAPISPQERYALVAHETYRPAPLPVAEDENGIRNPHSRKERLRAKLSNFYYGESLEPLTEDEVREALAHQDGHAHGHEELPGDTEPRELTGADGTTSRSGPDA
jgi:ubiquinol-cytochrome c reductase cytochrome b subunit